MSLAAAVKNIEREFGKGSIFTLGDPSATVPVEVISTGALTLDIALGVRGMPRGRIVEIFGPESSGKTTLALHVCAEAQKKGLQIAYIDAEHALDPAYALALGANPDEFLLSQPDYGEQALNILGRLVASGGIGVAVVDSVAALTPKAELDGEFGEAHVGRQARMMSQAMRMLAADVYRTKTLVIFVNQIREKIGVMFGSPETTPGGRALKYYASQRLDIRRIATEGPVGEQTHNRVKVKVVKNKVAPPFRVAEFDLVFGAGIDTAGCLLDIGIERGLIKKSGSWFSIAKTGDILGQGRTSAKLMVTELPQLIDQIVEAA